jgi:hypothetical protein
MLSLTATDTQEQTAAVFRALANGGKRTTELSQWQALQTWLASSLCEVVIPYAPSLAEMVPPVAIRLRRDFETVLNLIRAHAALHQTSRRKDASGRLIAEIADYAAVRELVADLVAEGADATIKPEVRETVSAVAALIAEGKDEVMQADIKKALKLDKSAVSRRVSVAVDAGGCATVRTVRAAQRDWCWATPCQTKSSYCPDRSGCTVAWLASRISSPR